MLKIFCKSRRFRNANHSWFNGRVYDLVNETELVTSSLRVPSALMDEWKRWIDIEVDLCNETRASILTSEMQEMDRRRSNAFSRLVDQVKHYLKSTDSEDVKAAARLATLLGAYSGANREKVSVKTQIIAGFIIDLTKPEFAASIDALQLHAEVDALQSYNTRYESLYNQRVEFYKNRRKQSMEKVRPIADDCFDQVATVIEAAYICASTPEDKAALYDLIALVNEHVIQILNMTKQTLSGSSETSNAGQTEVPVVGQSDGDNDLEPSSPQTDDSQGQTPADEPSNHSTPTDDEGDSSGTGSDQGGSQSGDTGGTPTLPDTGGFMG